jgi:pimeloyl-ACP methyl ester carboxylesterase/DNA-binding CsgD family transcriptional regulator
MSAQINEELVSKIYQTALNPSLWGALVESISNNAAASDRDSNRVIVNHLYQAIDIFSEIQHERSGREALKTALNQLPLGVLVIDSAQNIIETNDFAASLIRNSQHLNIKGSQLWLADSLVNRSFRGLLATITSDYAEFDADQLKHFIVGSELAVEEEVSIFVVPADAVDSERQKNTGNVLVFLTVGKSDFQLNNKVLKQIYRLTDAECRLLNALIKGANKLPEVAEKLALSYHTVRSYLKSVLEKTNTNSQTELLKLVLTTPALHMPLLDQSKLASHKYGDSSRQRSITLKDDRELCISEYGVLDGYPVFYFHGLSGCRLECDHPVEQLMINNIRLIAIDRPGFGGSTKDPNKSFQSWCEDMDDFCRHEKIGKFSIITYSSGSAWGLFCCQHFGDRVQQLCLVSNVGLNPFTTIKNNSLYTNQAMVNITKRSPAISGALLQLMCKLFYSDINHYFTQIRGQLSKADQLTINEYSAHIARAFAGRGKDGWKEMGNELRILTTDWFDDLNEISCPVIIWHGRDDQHVPIEAMEALLPKFTDVELNYIDKQGHYMLHRMWSDIVSAVAIPSVY